MARLGTLMTGTDDPRRWRLVAEFLEDYRQEPREARAGLLADPPAPAGDSHRNVFPAALPGHAAARDGRHPAPGRAEDRALPSSWFPFNTRAARADAIVHAPAAFRRRGVYVSPQEPEAA